MPDISVDNKRSPHMYGKIGFNHTQHSSKTNLPKLAMQITQCLHAAVLVSNLERAEHFYGQVLGLSKIERSLKYPGAWYQIGEMQLHLIVAPTINVELQNPQKWGRNPHIALRVANLDAAKNQLIAHNCPIQTSASGRAALFTQDPDSNIIELGQP